MSSALRHLSAVRFFLACWILFSLAGVGWSLAVPLFATYDEPAHVAHAVALHHGQLVGRSVDQPGQMFSHVDKVRIPAYYGTADASVQCFALNMSKSAACAPGFGGSGATKSQVTTWVARYQPLYYALVGLPSLVLGGAKAVYVMRFISAVVCGALLAIGMVALRKTQLPRAALAAGTIAATPTTVYLAGMVNPSGFEIAAAFATWAILLPAVLDPREHDVPSRLLAGAASAAVLVNARPASGLLAVMIGLTLVLLATRLFWSRVGGKRTWAAVAVAVVAGATTLGWTVVFRPTSTLGGLPAPQLADPAKAAASAFMTTRVYVQQMIATFWDTPGPLFTLIVWAGLLGVVIVAALAMADIRGRIALAVTLSACVLVPVVGQVPSAARLGLIWQGRYLLPYAVGVPLVAYGLLVQRREGVVLGRAISGAVIVLGGLGQVVGLGWVLWRFAYGLDKVPVLDPAGWAPPHGGLVLPVLLIVVAMAGLSWLFLSAPQEEMPLETAAHDEASRLELPGLETTVRKPVPEPVEAAVVPRRAAVEAPGQTVPATSARA